MAGSAGAALFLIKYSAMLSVIAKDAFRGIPDGGVILAFLLYPPGNAGISPGANAVVFDDTAGNRVMVWSLQ